MKNSIINKGLCLMSLFVFGSLPIFAGGPRGALLRAGRNMLRHPAKSYPVSYVRTRVPVRGQISRNVERQVAASQLAAIPQIQTRQIVNPKRLLDNPSQEAIELERQRDMRMRLMQGRTIIHPQEEWVGIHTGREVLPSDMPEVVSPETLQWYKAMLQPDGSVGLAALQDEVARAEAKANLSSAEARLLEAASNGDLATLKDLFESGVKPRGIDEIFELFKAALPYPKMVEYLLTVPDPAIQEAVAADGKSELDWFVKLAVKGGHKESFLILMNRYATFWNEFDKVRLLQIALDNKHLEIAEELIGKFEVSADDTLKAYLNYNMNKLTDQSLMFLLRRGGGSYAMFKPSDTQILDEKLIAMTEEGRNPIMTKSEINAAYQYQAFHALAENPSLPERFGISAVEYAKRSYESPAAINVRELGNDWYKQLQVEGVITIK